MSKLSGISDLNIEGLKKISDHILVKQAHNLTIQKWEYENYDKLMVNHAFIYDSWYATVEKSKLTSGENKIISFFFHYNFIIYYLIFILLIWIGGLLNLLVNDFKKKIENKSQTELFVYGMVIII